MNVLKLQSKLAYGYIFQLVIINFFLYLNLYFNMNQIGIPLVSSHDTMSH